MTRSPLCLQPLSVTFEPTRASVDSSASSTLATPTRDAAQTESHACARPRPPLQRSRSLLPLGELEGTPFGLVGPSGLKVQSVKGCV